MNKLASGFILSVLFLGTTDAALAAPQMTLRPDNGYSVPLTADQRKEVDKLFAEHLTAIEPLRKQLQTRKLELNALSHNPRADPEKIRRLAGEIARLNTQMFQAGRGLHEKLAALGGKDSCPETLGMGL